MTKEEIINKLSSEFGYSYNDVLWPDGTVMTHKFTIADNHDSESTWIISIEDHHGERPDVDDFLIFCGYHDPEQKDWYGHQIDICGAVEYEVMKLIVEFTEILKKEEK